MLKCCLNTVQRKACRQQCDAVKPSTVAQRTSLRGCQLPNLSVYLATQQRASWFSTPKQHCLTSWWRRSASDVKVILFSLHLIAIVCYIYKLLISSTELLVRLLTVDGQNRFQAESIRLANRTGKFFYSVVIEYVLYYRRIATIAVSVSYSVSFCTISLLPHLFLSTVRVLWLVIVLWYVWTLKH